MDIITAEQAAEAAKGLTFEKVWAALMDMQKRMDIRDEEYRKRMEVRDEEYKKRMEESRRQMQEQIQEVNEQTKKELKVSLLETRKVVADLSKNVGGVNNSLGLFTESLFSTGLDEKFNELGYPFTKQGPHVKFKEDGKVIAEADYFLENGDYAMAVEVKTELKESDVNEHMQRIAAIRRYFDARNDKRILLGAVAGGIINDNVLKYALKQGLYVITQSGDSIVIAEMPQGFKAREW